MGKNLRARQDKIRLEKVFYSFYMLLIYILAEGERRLPKSHAKYKESKKSRHQI